MERRTFLPLAAAAWLGATAINVSNRYSEESEKLEAVGEAIQALHEACAETAKDILVKTPRAQDEYGFERVMSDELRRIRQSAQTHECDVDVAIKGDAYTPGELMKAFGYLPEQEITIWTSVNCGNLSATQFEKTQCEANTTYESTFGTRFYAREVLD